MVGRCYMKLLDSEEFSPPGDDVDFCRFRYYWSQSGQTRLVVNFNVEREVSERRISPDFPGANWPSCVTPPRSLCVLLLKDGIEQADTEGALVITP